MSESAGVVLRRLSESEIASQRRRASQCRGFENEGDFGCRSCESERELVC